MLNLHWLETGTVSEEDRGLCLHGPGPSCSSSTGEYFRIESVKSHHLCVFQADFYHPFSKNYSSQFIIVKFCSPYFCTALPSRLNNITYVGRKFYHQTTTASNHYSFAKFVVIFLLSTLKWDIRTSIILFKIFHRYWHLHQLKTHKVRSRASTLPITIHAEWVLVQRVQRSTEYYLFRIMRWLFLSKFINRPRWWVQFE